MATTPIRNADGTFNGSIGAGKHAAPTALTAPVTPAHLVPESSTDGLHQQVALFARAQGTIQIPDFADPDATVDVVNRLQKMGEKVADRLDHLRDYEKSARKGNHRILNPLTADALAETLRDRQTALHRASMAALEHLHAAHGILEERPAEETKTSVSMVSDADDVGHTAWKISCWFDDHDDVQESWNRGDLAVVQKIQRASAHILKAKHYLDVALTADDDTAEAGNTADDEE